MKIWLRGNITPKTSIPDTGFKEELKIRPEGGEKAGRPLARTKESFLKRGTSNN